MWAYCDWVTKTLNADMPFDRFTIVYWFSVTLSFEIPGLASSDKRTKGSLLEWGTLSPKPPRVLRIEPKAKWEGSRAVRLAHPPDASLPDQTRRSSCSPAEPYPPAWQYQYSMKSRLPCDAGYDVVVRARLRAFGRARRRSPCRSQAACLSEGRWGQGRWGQSLNSE